MRVYLADLNHEGHNIKTFPYAAGCVASFARKEIGPRLEVEIFKSVRALAAAVESRAPDVLGFSNYLWNGYLTQAVARHIRSVLPRVPVIVGGPNYPESRDEQRAFLERHPEIDCYVYHEGELTFSLLLRALLARDLDARALRDEGLVIPGCHYLRDGSLVAGEEPAKIQDIDGAFPSPYLEGLFDRFFDEGLDPVLQFTRGCPFSCTFCTEGLPYYSRLGRSSVDRFVAELEYCAKRVHGNPTLYLADANFGMFKEDVDLCQAIAAVQRTYGWPELVNASTGKNQQERILSATRILGGSLRFGAALQSTDEAVLKNVKRTNISTSILLGAAARAREWGQNSYSELILNLPGDTYETHLQSIRAPVEAGINRIQMYPLVLLPGTEMCTPEARRRYGMRTRFRVLPRCYGHYSIGGRAAPVGEVVEMLVETDVMPFEDYLRCKEFELTVELFYNDGYFGEVHGLLEHLGLSMFDFLRECHGLRGEFPADLADLYAGLRRMATEELFPTREDCERFVGEGTNLSDYARSEYKNSLATNRAIGVFTCARSIHEVARRAARTLLDRNGFTGGLSSYLDELFRFSLMRKDNLLDPEYSPQSTFRYAFADLERVAFRASPELFTLRHGRSVRFRQSGETVARISELCRQYEEPVMKMRNVLYYSAVTTLASYFRGFEFLAPEAVVSD